MALKYPKNGLYVVLGEISTLMTSMKKFHWSSRSYQENENNPLLKNLSELKVILNQISDLREIELNTFIDPFLDVIHSEETSVQVTALALSSINKFISYGLIGGVSTNYLLPVIDRIANVVAHVNCTTSDHSSDNIIYMKIVEALRSLVLSPLGHQLTNDRICDIMLTCFKICFETRLNELLRHNAEHCLKNIVQFLFSRLPLFIQTPADFSVSHKKMSMRPKNKDGSHKKENKQSSSKYTILKKTSVSCNEDAAEKSPEPSSPLHSENEPTEIMCESSQLEVKDFKEADITAGNKATDVVEHLACSEGNIEENVLEANSNILEKGKDTGDVKTDVVSDENNAVSENIYPIPSSPTPAESSSLTEEINNKQYVNSQGVRFMSDDPNLKDWLIAERIPLEPHNSICVQELLRFLAVICNPHDKQNTDVMRHISLSLLTIALEVGADAICGHPLLLTIIKDTLCRNLLSLMNSERIPKQIFAATLHVSFLLFESMRNHLKFQMEYFLSHLSEIIVADTPKVSYDLKELALESLVQLWRIPGLVTELFLNYDCDLYCPNLYEDITKLLSKNVYPVDGIYSTHLLSLDALLAVIESIEKHCHSLISNYKVTHDLNSDCVVSANTEESSPLKCTSKKENSFRESEPGDKRQINYNVPSHEHLMAIKRKKKLLTTGTEHFNANPKKGIQFLQEQGILSTPLKPAEVATFLRENPHLDKKQIGEYISHRSNLKILEQFVESFDFTNMRLDQALRLYLESFRLPGESPLISMVLQHFTDYWHKSNNEPFSKSESAFLLAYAIIMLNTDLHNQVVRRQQPPMTLEGFKKNLKGLDDGKDFDQDLLDAIYQSIKNDEIVMPAEHVGLVRENYLWEMLLRRGLTKDGAYVRAQDGLYDHELFSLCWSPVVAALGYVFDKTSDSFVYYKSVQGFRKCATISAHYGMSNEFDYVTLSLCRFTMLTNSLENPESFTVSFGMNAKARLAARTVFDLVHRHGDILREGWRPIFDCIFQLFRYRLLPKILVEGEDFLELSGKVSLIREDVTNNKSMESGLLSSLYSYIALATDVSSPKITSEEEKEYVDIAKTCIGDCHIENLIQESKFLRLESLYELLKVLIRACYNSECNIVLSTREDEDKAIFFLELLLKVVIQNRDRTSSVWPMVCDHLHALLMAAASADQQFLIERCVIGLLRLAIRLMRRDEISSSVLQSLQIILLLKWNTVYSVSRQISYGLHELLKTGAADIHSEADWAILFTVFEVVGAGAPLPKLNSGNDDVVVGGSSNDGKFSDDTNADGAAEDSGLGGDKQYLSSSDSSLNQLSVTIPSCKSYLFQNDCDDGNMKSFYTCDDLLPHDPFALVKCCESLAFLIRDVAHITPFNFKNCIHTMRTFVEATLYTGERKPSKKKTSTSSKTRTKNRNNTSSRKTKYTNAKSQNNPYDADESDPEEYPDSYFQVPLQLLDLMHTLHTKTAHIHNGWTETNTEQEVSSLWSYGWCPLLQGIARLCSDPRKSVRMSAITYLQRALLMHDLQKLKANEWESCFNNVLFPLLEKLAEPFQGKDFVGVEETRMRATTLLSKVFLHHLSPLQLLPTFTSLWLKILSYMNRYMDIDKNSDLLNEAIQECVKNMILVMESSQLFSDDGGLTQFWELTWEKVDKFIPNLKHELFRHHSSVHDGSDQHQTSNSPESPETDYSEYKIDKNVTSEEHVEPKLANNSLVKHSVPIFPHMGQLISTPIGPQPVSKNHEDKYPRNFTGSAENINFHTQMSSLIMSNPDFLASLPSFKAQSPNAIFGPVDSRFSTNPSITRLSTFDVPPSVPQFQYPTYVSMDTVHVLPTESGTVTHPNKQLQYSNSVSSDCMRVSLTESGSFIQTNAEPQYPNSVSPDCVQVSPTESGIFKQPNTPPQYPDSALLDCVRVSPTEIENVAQPRTQVMYSNPLSSTEQTAFACSENVVNMNSFPYVIQRSSSVCETSDVNSQKPNAMPEISRTESFPTLSQTYTSFGEPQSSNAACIQTVDEQWSIEHSDSVYDATSFMQPVQLSSNEPMISCEKKDISCENTIKSPDAPNYDKTSETSPAPSFPVYSGFAQLSSDVINNTEGSNAKQFFYQNW